MDIAALQPQTPTHTHTCLCCNHLVNGRKGRLPGLFQMLPMSAPYSPKTNAVPGTVVKRPVFACSYPCGKDMEWYLSKGQPCFILAMNRDWPHATFFHPVPLALYVLDIPPTYQQVTGCDLGPPPESAHSLPAHCVHVFISMD